MRSEEFGYEAKQRRVMDKTLIGAMVIGGAAILLFAGGSIGEARARTRGAPGYSRERFSRVLTGMGLDPARLSEADWQIVDRAMMEAQRIARMTPEEQGAALQASPSFRAYIALMIERYGDSFRRTMEG